jgi:hypothetical protein
MAVPVYWDPKDPDETVNYELRWDGQLAAGDLIATSAWTDVTGAVVEVDSVRADNLATLARVSGGADGVTAALTNTITTTEGETLEQLVLLPIVANVAAPADSDYRMPTPGELGAKYPAFAAVPYSTVQVHLNDAATSVDTTWREVDYAPAVMALAAHKMTLLDIGDHGEIEGYARRGLSSIRSGGFSAQFSDKKVGAACGGTFDATPYGREYALLLRRNKAGPRIVPSSAAPSDYWGPTAQQNDGGILPWAY